MNLAAIVSIVQRACKLDDSQKELVEETIKADVLDLLSNDWNFLEDSSTTVTVFNQSDYTLDGANDDCGVIKTVWVDGVPIDFKDRLEFDTASYGTISQSQQNHVGVYCWTLKETSTTGFPTIEFFGTPQLADKTIYYVYRKKIDPADPLSLLPIEMEGLVRLRALALFTGNQAFYDRAADALTGALRRDRKANQRWSPVKLDPYTEGRNVQINRTDGYPDVSATLLLP